MTPLVIAANPRALAERVLTSATVMLDASCTAIFQREQDQMILFASRGIRQTGMDLVSYAWRERRAALLAGEGLITAAPVKEAVDETVRAVLAENDAFAVTPVVHADRVLGLLYIEGPKPLAGSRQPVVGQLAGIAAIALRAPAAPSSGPMAIPASGVDAYLERTPPAEIAREQLLVLLDRHEWNLSRVARALCVSRRTMYLRLERYGIERRHVPKVIRRREAT
jgi:hypothetical protein